MQLATFVFCTIIVKDSCNMTKIFFCGDIINRFSDHGFIGQKLESFIKDADYAIGNFEGTLFYEGMEGVGMVQRPSTLAVLRNAGFDLLLLANNHIGDYGKDGFTHTLREIDKYGFDRTGAGFSYEEAYRPFIKEINGMRFGFLNICEALCCLYKHPSQDYGCAWTGAKILEHIIPALKEKVDFLVVLPHSGLELNDYPLEHTKELYHHYCDLGADCIVAAHPHVPQGMEEYNGRCIFYSLGNFYSPESAHCNSSLSTNQSFSVILTFGDDRIKYKVLYHQTDSICVEITEKPNKDLSVLSSYLAEPAYSKLVGEQNKRVFDNEVLSLYRDAIYGITRVLPFKEKVKIALRLFKSLNSSQLNEYLKSFHKLTQSETYIHLIDSAINNKTVR